MVRILWNAMQCILPFRKKESLSESYGDYSGPPNTNNIQVFVVCLCAYQFMRPVPYRFSYCNIASPNLYQTCSLPSLYLHQQLLCMYSIFNLTSQGEVSH